MPDYNDLQLIKRKFFAMRNGVIADTLRKAGSPFRMIFGLNLPQIIEVSAQWKGNRDFARQLWGDVHTRESLLAACAIMPPEKMSREEALKWVETSPSTETTDLLCHKVLRHMPEAMNIVREMIGSPRSLTRYAAIRLMFNLVGKHHAEILPLAKSMLKDSDEANASLAALLIEEIDYLG